MNGVKNMRVDKVREERKQFLTGYLIALAIAFFFSNTWLISVAIMIFFIYETDKAVGIESGIKKLYYVLTLFPVLNLIPLIGIWIRFNNVEQMVCKAE